MNHYVERVRPFINVRTKRLEGGKVNEKAGMSICPYT